MKGIILAGGSGTRLHPLTMGISKQLLPVYDKPMIYYPLSVLMLAGIRDIQIISTPNDLPRFSNLLKDGSQLGISLTYATQHTPNGIAQAFHISEKFIGNNPSCLILGDNIFYGYGFSAILDGIVKDADGATIFGYHVSDPQRFGILEFDSVGQVQSIEEKPLNPKSNYAVPGLYFYDKNVVQISKEIKPSNRGELEITDINKAYLRDNLLKAVPLGRGFAWLDLGTHDSLLDASQFVSTIERRQGFKIACIEEIAYNKKWIDASGLEEQGKRYENSSYGEYILNIIK